MKKNLEPEPSFSCLMKTSPLFLISKNQIKLVIVVGKRKIEYIGILVNIDTHFNILLKKANFFLRKKKKILEFLNCFDRIVLSGNKVDLVFHSII